MSDDQSKNNIINSYPFYEFHHDHHTMLSDQGFAFPIVTDHHTTNFNPFMQYNQNPTQFDHINFLQGYNTLSAGLDHSNEAAAAGTTSGGGGGGGGGGSDNVPLTPNSSASCSSQEAGVEEDSSKSKKDVQAKACGDGDGKSKNVKAKEKEEKKQRQARFAFMTKSEVDNLEDGYRWRKYGQKAVKNSSFPRSYYRCTSQKCSVKKRIERSQQDPSVVITTYEGQHNHHSPAAIRGNAAAMLAPSLFSPPPAAFTQDMFFPSTNQTNPTTFYTQLTDHSNHHHRRQPPPEIADQYNFVMPGPAVGSSFLYKPVP